MVSDRPESTLPRPAPRGAGKGNRATRGTRLALLLAWPPVLGIGLLATIDAFGLGDDFAVAAWTSGLWLIGLTLILGLRDLRAAEARTNEALVRAEAAESRQRARADELATVLQASEGLTLMGENTLDFRAILAALTPADATSYLARIDGEAQSVVVAAHGPLAPWLIGARRSLDPNRPDDAQPAPQLTSSSVSGNIVGIAGTPAELALSGASVMATLGVRLASHGGRSLGRLYLLDPTGDRILEPEFVALAQLVANQVGVALENQALLGRVQHQLTETQRVQQQLVQASKLAAVGELAAAVAHEVNNPLTGILGFSELLMGEIPADDPRHEEAAVIQSEAVRARSIMRALLEFARPRAPQRIPSDLNALVESSLELVRFSAQEAGVAISEEYGDLPSLEIDPDAFKQVALNLLNNAIYAMPNGGHLAVTTANLGDRVGFSITDDGVGMDPQTQARIFTPFFSTRAGAESGSGLGLSVSLQIVESHGGTIEVRSRPGHGATFSVWLPARWAAFDGAVIVPGESYADRRAAEGHAEEARAEEALAHGDVADAAMAGAAAVAVAVDERSRGEAA
jgi:signal transduction histidine kinase